ncbi:U-box domain-containing protein 21 [Coffea eugenioides]|uniref:U-box domain-containing protein n=1 Tax=Coffea arabica TaxID=13443 RepID=A0A6P6TKI3_COFAR|nr:U-box domain-containing protein 21-like [Coffea arabica]XP_027179803.1 U-box domain-containing protein 21 [Coffea eugenioides]
MIFSWRHKRANRRGQARKNEALEGNCDLELTIPKHFQCPISLDLMKDPVTLSTGITYDRENIERWIEAGNQTCPVTNQALKSFDQIPNHSIRRMIQDWCVENKSYGVERIPTPRIPITPYEVSEISSKIVAATTRKDGNKCQELVGKIRNLAKESERNKKRVVENGVGYVLSSSFETFAGDSMEKHEVLLKEILSALTWMFPLGIEGQSKLGSSASLRCIAWFLHGEDLSTRQHAVMVLKELLANSLDHQISDGLIEIEGISEALFKILKVPIGPTATKASLMVTYYMLQSEKSEKLASRFVEMGLVSLVVEMLVDGEKSTSEKALGVLEAICNWEEGREKACSNALTMPLLVKKILRVSEMGTEFAVSTLSKLCKEVEDENPVIEALEVGAFQKLLVVLQVGCGENTKEKITELLKLMNLYRNRIDCFDSLSGFKYIQRPY